MNWCELGMWRLENKILKIKRHVLSFLFLTSTVIFAVACLARTILASTMHAITLTVITFFHNHKYILKIIYHTIGLCIYYYFLKKKQIFF